MHAHERRARCTATHTTTDGTTWTRGSNEALGVIICADGRPQYKFRCRQCDTKGTPVSTVLLTGWGYTPANIEWKQFNAPRPYEPCSVKSCISTPTEMHHFAPYNTFNADANNWPVMPLCRAHHVEWHRRMDGYRWHKSGVAA